MDVVVHYRDPVKGGLLRDAVLPAVRTARADGLHGHVERHWRHGPHLRLRLRGEPGAVADVAERTAHTMRCHLAAHPSRSTVTEAALLAAAERAGRAELVPGPYTPIRPDNTVLVQPVTAAADADLAALLGSSATVALREDLLGLGTDALEAAVRANTDRGDTAQARVWTALTALSVHAAAYPLGLAAGYVSFLSHVEEFLFLNDSDGTIRLGFDSSWDRCADRVLTHVAAVEAGAGGSAAQAWREWAEGTWSRCRPAFRRGDIPLTPGTEYARRAGGLGERTARQWDPGRREDYSEFHRALLAFDHTAGVEEHFGPYRFATNVLYQLLVVADIAPTERYLAAHLLSRAVQARTGVPWRVGLGRARAAADRPAPDVPAAAVPAVRVVAPSGGSR